MTYNIESKKFFIENQTELFAHELYMNNKYSKNGNEDIERLLNSFLNSSWFLSEKEKRKILKNVIIISKKKYNLILDKSE